MNTVIKEGQYDSEAHSELSQEFISYVSEVRKNEIIEALFGEPVKWPGDEPLAVPLDLYFGIKVDNVWGNGVASEDLEDFDLRPFKIEGTGWIESGDLKKAAQHLMQEIHEKEIYGGLSLLAQLDTKLFKTLKPNKLQHDDVILLGEKVIVTDLFVSEEQAENISNGSLTYLNLVINEQEDGTLKTGSFETWQRSFLGVNHHGVKGLEKGGELNKLFAQTGGWNPDERELGIAVDGTQESFLHAIKEVDGKTIKIYPVAENVDGEWKIGFKGETEQGFLFAGKGVSFLLI